MIRDPLKTRATTFRKINIYVQANYHQIVILLSLLAAFPNDSSINDAYKMEEIHKEEDHLQTLVGLLFVLYTKELIPISAPSIFVLRVFFSLLLSFFFFFFLLSLFRFLLGDLGRL